MTSTSNTPFNFEKPYMDLLSTLFKICVFTTPGYLWLILYGKNLFGEQSLPIYATMPLFSAIFAACGILGYALIITLNQWALRLSLSREYQQDLRETVRLQYGDIQEGPHAPVWSEEEYQHQRKMAGKEYWHEWDKAFGGTATQVPRLGSLIGSSLSIALLLTFLYLRNQNILSVSMEWATFVCASVIFLVSILAATLDQISRVHTLLRKFAVVGVFMFLCLVFYFATTSFISILI